MTARLTGRVWLNASAQQVDQGRPARVTFALLKKCRPRARGGGPAAVQEAVPFGLSSPRSRGWSHGGLAVGAHVPVVPALAGVVPCAARTVTGDRGRPRARGGGPGSVRPDATAAGSSPRSRGWSPERPADRGGVRVVPALAGVVPRRRGRRLHPRVVPALAGVVPRTRRARRRRRRRPRARGGWSFVHTLDPAKGDVVPALAGVVPLGPGRGPARRSRPRARGGGPGTNRALDQQTESSPRSLGWSRPRRTGRGPGWVVPALAGVVPRGRRCRASRPRRPRARGGGPYPSYQHVGNGGSSPRSRGWSRAGLLLREHPAVVPALAGVVPTRRACSSRSPSRPRARGGGPMSRSAIT